MTHAVRIGPGLGNPASTEEIGGLGRRAEISGDLCFEPGGPALAEEAYGVEDQEFFGVVLNWSAGRRAG
jgi:hypothetical protein